MNFVFYDLIPMLTQEELTYLFENRTTFEEFKKIITSNKACKRFFKTDNDLKSFYAQFKIMKDKKDTSSEPSAAFSVKIESDKTLNMKKIERKMSKVDVDSIIKDLLALDYSADEINYVLEEEFSKAINDEDINVVVSDGKEIWDGVEDRLFAGRTELKSVKLPDDFNIGNMEKVIEFIEEDPNRDIAEIEEYVDNIGKTTHKRLLNRIFRYFKR